MSKLQTLTLNLSTKLVRDEVLEGRAHKVVPMVMLVEGVANGSCGRLKYTANEMRKALNVWNYKPVTQYHPTINGSGVSACTPVILNQSKIGVILNTRVDNKGPNGAARLVAEAWIDWQRCQEVDKRIAKAITNQKPMELSTGLFVDIEEVTDNEEYDGIATNFRPDHLAVLPDKKGACSLADGAGFIRNEGEDSDEEDDGESVESADPIGEDAKVPQSSAGIGKRISKKAVKAANKPQKISVMEAANNEQSQNDLREALQSAIQARFVKTSSDGKSVGGYAWVQDVFSSYAVFTLDGKTYKIGYTVGEDDSVVLSKDNPTEVRRTTQYRDKATGKVVANGGPGSGRYEKGSTGNSVESKRIGYTTYLKSGSQLGEVKGPYNPGGVWKAEVYKTNDKFEAAWKESKLTDVQRGKISHGADRVISAMTFGSTGSVSSDLASGQTCIGYRYKTKKDAINAIHAHFSNAGKKPATNSASLTKGTTITQNNDNMNKKIKQLVDALISNESSNWMNEDREFLSGLTINQLNALATRDGIELTENGASEDNDGDIEGNDETTDEATEDESEDGETDDTAGSDTVKGKASAKATTEKECANEEGSEDEEISLNEYISKAPPALREVLNEGIAANQAQKKECISAIVANKANEFTKEELSQMPINQLRRLAKLAANSAQPVKRSTPAPRGLFAGQAPVANEMTTNGGEESLELPTMTFNTEKKGKR